MAYRLGVAARDPRQALHNAARRYCAVPPAEAARRAAPAAVGRMLRYYRESGHFPAAPARWEARRRA